MTRRELPRELLARRAIVYVRQSTANQVQENLESQRRQYELVNLARSYGFTDVLVVDEDLGRSASGTVDRPGFRNLVGQICEGTVGAVFCLEASRLARNGRDWHHLLELCGLVGTLVVDTDGAYDPATPNDRLLLGLKGTMSEFELTLLRKRMTEGAVAKARRGDLRIAVPAGYVWSSEFGLTMDPDRRVQDAIRTVFQLFDRLGSARQVLIHMRRERVLFPRRVEAHRTTQWCWRLAVYFNVIRVLQNPFYAGAYAYGKSHVQTTIVDGRIRKTYGRERPRHAWAILLRDHHEAYISWSQYEQNQERIARNSFRLPAGNSKSGRGGHALMSGLLRCRRCGRMLRVHYSNRDSSPRLRYTCPGGDKMHGVAPCISFSGARPDAAIGREILLAVQPLAREAAVVAEQTAAEQFEERRRAVELERQQAAYEVKLAARRYESVDPDNRLVAAELEARWNAALTRLRECEGRLAAASTEPAPPGLTREELGALADDLETVWAAPGTTMRTRQRLARTLIQQIVVDVDDASREVVLVVHWRGGQHSELRVRKPASGETTKHTSDVAHRLIQEMASRWSDADIAATLNRMGLTTGQGNTWTAALVGFDRRKAAIRGYASAVEDGGSFLTMIEAAGKLQVSRHAIRRLIKTGVLPARQVASDAPWQILGSDLERPEVHQALRRRSTRRGRPCRNSRDDRTLAITGTSEGGAQ